MRTYIIGSRRLSNIFWALAVTLGGCGFFLSGLASYTKTDLFFFTNSSEIAFIPQGIVLIFYGSVGSILGLFLCLTIWWDVGFGYNDYNSELQTILLYRKGFPGKNRELKLNFSFDEVKAVKISIKEGLNPKRQLLLCLKDRREIPLTGVDQPTALSKIEAEAVGLAKYLNVYLETLVE
uniref:photosystem I assembly protein Ycf4 n=1 Tax=Ochrosphaera neapolitana TaxID=35137 RepID=UPI00286C7349|nr:photosystem I assembly protein Ycf4 [Ochrosphaera neapolitana]WKK50101.1 photosystem I assembly protein Ycf4 [Ochrosphaera neapolitana]